jgi:hypothetical protein
LRTEAVALLALALVSSCGGGGDTCGAKEPAAGEADLVSTGGEIFRYHNLHAALAGDCPLVTGSRGSVTITGQQLDTGFPLTFCVRRENDVQSGQPIQLADATFIQVVDVSARDAAGCTYRQDLAAVPTGTISFDGFCTTGGTQYNLTLAGSIGGVRTCPAGDAGPMSSTAVPLTLAGTVLVTMDATASP